MGVIGLVLAVNFIKRKLAMRNSSAKVDLLEPDEKAETGDYVVVKEEKAVMA
jgi:hypothetical protein